MKLFLYIDESGLERLAKGNHVYSWDIRVVLDGDQPPKTSLPITDAIEVFLPDRAASARIAVEALQEKKRLIYLEAEKDAREVEERIQNLLAIEGPST